jgi:hypothetical protein
VNRLACRTLAILIFVALYDGMKIINILNGKMVLLMVLPF